MVEALMLGKSVTISVLLPTRDRYELLQRAIKSVLAQDYPDWELLVSDNMSIDNVEALIASLSDPRVHFKRTSSILPVTENWNHALAMATGDYIVMLGDDDFLLPGALSRIAKAAREWEMPEVFYVGALEFAYPGVVPRYPAGFVSDYNYSEFMRRRKKAAALPVPQARRVARAAMDFRLRYGFNMQFFVFSRTFIESLRRLGPFFQSPFPDYYAANVTMLMALRIVLLPERLVAIGISDKSYGFYHLNHRETEGMNFLGADMQRDPELQRVLLPGSNINTSWAISMATVKENLGGMMPLRVAYNRYRRLQIISQLFARYDQGRAGGSEMQWPLLSLAEKAFLILLTVPFVLAAFLRGRARRIAFSLLNLSTGQYIVHWRRPVRGFPTPETLINAWRPEWAHGGPGIPKE